MSRSTLVLLFLLANLVPAGARAEAPGLGRKLARLRAEVDALEVRLERVRSRARTERQSLETQQGDLEVLLRKEQVRRETLNRLRARQVAERRKAEARTAELHAPARDAAGRLERHVRSTLPFHRAERLAAVQEIADGLERAGCDPANALSRLWQLVEDELKLTAEAGLHRQVVELGGERVLAEVARLGMAMLYFRTEDGQYGWAVPRDGDWVFETLVDPHRVEAVELLFEALRKQIRKGYFELPLTASPVAGFEVRHAD